VTREASGRAKRGPRPEANNEELLEQLRLTESQSSEHAELEERITARNVGLVKSIALKFAASGEQVDDLIQAGYIGLLSAVANYDLAHNTKFSTYASHLIQGEIRHYIRDRHSTIRIPQWVQTMNRRIKQAEEAYFQEHGQPPTLRELGAALDLSESQLAALLRGRDAMTYVSIDQERRSSDPNPSPPTLEEIMPESCGFPLDTRMRIVAAIDRLAQMQQLIVQGLFYQGKSQSEVGEELGISQRQVSRIKDRAIEELRQALLHLGAPESRQEQEEETDSDI
jgi:RNA polymerase sigma-B factor